MCVQRYAQRSTNAGPEITWPENIIIIIGERSVELFFPEKTCSSLAINALCLLTNNVAAKIN